MLVLQLRSIGSHQKLLMQFLNIEHKIIIIVKMDETPLINIHINFTIFSASGSFFLC